VRKKIIFWTISMVLILSDFTKAGDASTAPITSAKSLALGGYNYAGLDGITTTFQNPGKILSTPGFGLAMNIIDRAGQQQCQKGSRDIHRSYLFNDFSGSAGIYWVPNQKFGLAMVYNRALDYSVRWPLALMFTENGITRLYGFQLKSRLIADAYSQVFGLQVGKMSLGAAINIYQIYQQFEFPISNPEWQTNRTNPVYALNLEQEDNAIGWSLGFILPITTTIKVGGSIRSGVDFDLEGNAKTDCFYALDSLAKKSRLHSRFQMPMTGGIGILYKPTDQLNLNIDLSSEFWGSTQSKLDFNYSDTAWSAIIAAAPRDSITGYWRSEMPFYDRNSFVFAIGLEYSGENNLKYRIGYNYQTTPNSDRSYSLLLPNVNQHRISAGIGFLFNQFYLDLSIAYSVGVAKDIKKSQDEYFYGKYDTKTIIPSINVEYQL